MVVRTDAQATRGLSGHPLADLTWFVLTTYGKRASRSGDTITHVTTRFCSFRGKRQQCVASGTLLIVPAKPERVQMRTPHMKGMPLVLIAS